MHRQKFKKYANNQKIVENGEAFIATLLHNTAKALTIKYQSQDMSHDQWKPLDIGQRITKNKIQKQ